MTETNGLAYFGAAAVTENFFCKIDTVKVFFTVEVIQIRSRGLYYKTFYGRNLQIFIIS
jgi:hypothetical protein